MEASVTKPEWYRIFLFVHILSAIVGLGPTFIFGRITGMGRSDPAHSRFATGVVHKLTTTSALPIAVVIFLSGLGMIWARGLNLWAAEWLMVAMGLFVVGFAYAAAVQSRLIRHILAIADADDFEGANPPPELAKLGRRVMWGGRYLRTSAVIILYLMIFKGFFPV